MSEKQYLLTESELKEISDYYDCTTSIPLMKDTEWLEAHEYIECKEQAKTVQETGNTVSEFRSKCNGQVYQECSF